MCVVCTSEQAEQRQPSTWVKLQNSDPKPSGVWGSDLRESHLSDPLKIPAEEQHRTGNKFVLVMQLLASSI